MSIDIKCEARIVNEDHLIDQMVNRFLSWQLPRDFTPDAGIDFTKPQNPDWWPVGTNLLTAEQAREMVKHLLDVDKKQE